MGEASGKGGIFLRKLVGEGEIFSRKFVEEIWRRTEDLIAVDIGCITDESSFATSELYG